MQAVVEQFLRGEDVGRVLLHGPGTSHGLFECLCHQVFVVDFEAFKTHFQDFMKMPDVTKLFKSIFQILDNTGNVPVKSEEESEDAYKARLDECYDGIVDKCSDIMPHSKFLHVYVFAISTLIGRPIYVLHEDESGDLSWSYFPVLFSHTYDPVRQSTNYTGKPYITMYFSTDFCHNIDSSRCSHVPPKSYGCIGLYRKLATRILLEDPIENRCVDQMKTQLKRPEVQLEFQGAISSEVIRRCLSEYDERHKGNVYRHDRVVTENTEFPRSLSTHRPDKNHFVTELLNNRELVKCLYKVLVEHKDGVTMFEQLQIRTAFMPIEFHDKLVRLENAILDMQGSTSTFVLRCRTTADELTDRRDKVNKSVIAGSAVGIVGGGLAIAGLILTPFTFGASLGLTIAGASLGAGGGIVGGAARAVEGIKQNISINEVKEIQNTMVTQENHLIDLLNDISTMISINLNRHLDNSVDGPGMNRRGFLAIGSAVRSLHGGVAIGLAAARVGAVGASIAASVLGPVSLALDIGFLAEAAHNLNKGSKTGAGEILELNAKAVEMKMVFFMCMLRGNIPATSRIVK